MATSTRRARTTALLAAACLALAGCGGSDGTAAPADPGSGSSMETGTATDGHGDEHGEGHDMSMPGMNDPDATPADQLPDAVTGAFTVLDTAPPGSDAVAGDAWLAQGEDGTTLTVRLTGLEPGTAYVGHLHAQPCAEDAGGPHFAFDPDGPATPPNEVHIAFTAGDDGAGEATATNDRQVGDAAPSVVVHPADAQDNRLACADL